MSARTPSLIPQVVDALRLSAAQRRDMFALYERYYDCSSFTVFCRDLQDKNHVLLLHTPRGELCGFSTLAVYAREIGGQRVRVVFSGDTIIDEQCWGSQSFAFAWLRWVGALKTQEPATPLYWLLISKGHRTYRYLPAFSLDYFPAHDRVTPPHIQHLLDFLAADRFAQAYDATRGLLHFACSQGHLRDAFAHVPEQHRALPEVRFFLERNPGYRDGDELVCLCELSAHNLRPLARRVFESAAEKAG